MVRAILEGRKTQTRRPFKMPRGMRWYGEPSELGGEAEGYVCDIDGEGWWHVEELACPFGAVGDELWVRENWRTHEDPKTLIDGILYQADGAFREIENTREAAERWMEAAHVKPRKEDYKRVANTNITVATPRKAKGWRPSIHQPRWASRLTLRVTSVRVERVNAISEADAIAEGLEIQQGDGTGPGPGYKWDGPGYYDGFSKGPYGRTFHVPHHDGLCCCNAGKRERLSAPVCAFRHLWDATYGKGSWARGDWVWVVGFERAG
jgi:hypothetical protein